MKNKPIKIVSYNSGVFEDIDNGYWRKYFVTVKMPDNNYKDGYCQGDTHSWALETFEEI